MKLKRNNALRQLINLENVFFVLLLFSSFCALLNKWGVYFLIVVLIMRFLIVKKECRSFTNRLFILLINFVPFYVLIRLSLLVQGLTILSSSVNYFRDFLIIVLVFATSCFFKSRSSKNVVFAIIFIANWLFGFLVSTFYGYISLAITGFHLTVIPLLLFFVAKSKRVKYGFEEFVSHLLRLSIIVAICGIYCYYKRPSFFIQLFEASGNMNDATNYVRFVSFFFTPNVCGCFLSMGLCAALSMLIIKKRLIYLLSSVLLVFCLALTLSRGSWMFGFAAVVMALFVFKPKVGFIVTGSFVALFAVLYLFGLRLLQTDNQMAEIINSRFLSLFDRNNYSAYERVDYWHTAFGILEKSPFGFGLGVSSTAQTARDIQTDVAVIDGFYVKTIIETGVFGILFCIAFVLWILKMVFLSYFRNKNLISILAVLMALGFLIQSFGSNTFDFVCTVPFLWIAIGYSTKKQVCPKCLTNYSNVGDYNRVVCNSIQ